MERLEVLDKDAVEEYRTAIEEWLNIGDKVLQLMDEGKEDEAEKVILEECTPMFKKGSRTSKAFRYRNRFSTSGGDGEKCKNHKPFVDFYRRNVACICCHSEFLLLLE